MGRFLKTLSAWTYDHPWRVIGIWLVVIAITGAAAATWYKAPSSSISIPGTKAQQALDEMSRLFPDAGSGSGRIVVAAPQGKTLDSYAAQIDGLAAKLAKVEGVEAAVAPSINTAAMSDDAKIAYIQLQLTHGQGRVEQATFEGVNHAVETARASTDMTVEMGGDIINKMPGEILGVGEVIGVIFALVVLVAVLGSLVAAGLPIVVALVTIGVSMGALFGLSHVIDVSSTTPVLAVMLGLAVGIDYSLFIVNKYRHYVVRGAAYREAAIRAVATAGNAVIFAAATVVIALASLAVVDIPFMTTMGLSAAATITVAAAVAVTLIPALLSFGGAKIFSRSMRTRIKRAQSLQAKKQPSKTETYKKNTVWAKWGVVLTKHPVGVLVGGLVVVAALAWPLPYLQMGLPTDEFAAKGSTERKAYDLLKEGFGAGFNAPLALVVDGVPAVTQAEKDGVKQQLLAKFAEQAATKQAELQANFEQRAGSVATPEDYASLQADVARAQQEGEAQKAAALQQIDIGAAELGKRLHLQSIADRIAKRGDVDTVQVAIANDSGTAGVIQIIPESAPMDDKTVDLIAALRDESNQRAWSENGSINYGVTGSTALQADINQRLADALPLYLTVVVGLSLVLLVIAFRSILIPIKATLGFLLSVAAMFGALVAVFQWGWFGIADAPGPIVSFIPIISLGVLFGLAMDYEFFLVSSMHEAHQQGDKPLQAVRHGFSVGAKVVTAAGIIMVAVFAGFISNHDATIQAIGFALALGILVDAFVVRMTIVPAVMTLLGKSAWWLPKWLDRRLPHVSIEGDEAS